MDIITFLISVYCLVDDSLKGQTLRRRGPQPTLSDAEVLTIEIVGEFLGIDTDAGLFRYFRRHFSGWFPGLKRIHRTTFTRQAANLWAIKRQLWQQVVALVPHDPLISVIDSFPMPVCRFARASRCRRFPGIATYGYDEVARQTYFGLRAHVRLGWPGVVTDFRLAPANIHDTAMAAEMLPGVCGWVLGDRNYWDPDLRSRLAAQGLHLLAPFKSRKREPFRYPYWLSWKRYRIETVIGQLVERFHAKKVWARDVWHLTSRWMRKLLSHSIAVMFCHQVGLSLLRLAELIVD